VQLPEGIVAIDAAQLGELRAAAAAGLEAHRRQERDDRDRLVTQAVSDGRIPPARREHWLAQLAADPGAAAVLASLAPVVPVEATGYAGGAETTDDDAVYASLFDTKAGA
jgi:phage I-like protein